ncbi:unnamed protein product [Blepharisma stoltei]|uniref:Bardet-Biedl syndrome 1 n=1 Tax=Blepharisma stoltei TaxID=1481888 RepID=A0AAU9K460_9CILI|nr:unnamed protein product [Blepharisma stoltei]
MELWTNSWQDPVAGLKATSACMCLGDLKSDGEYNLVIADLKKKLRVYRGTSIAWESLLLDVPSAVAIYYSEIDAPPNLAVASGSFIFIYKNSRPFFKFTLPNLELPPDEVSIWEALKESRMDPTEAIARLSSLRESMSLLSNRSLDLLSYDSDEERLEFIEATKLTPLVQNTSITTLGVLKLDQELENAVSVLVIGTEHKFLYVLDKTGSAIITKVVLPDVPAFISTAGLFSGEYRILVACRDSNIYTVKNGQLMPSIIELETHSVGLINIDRSIFVGSVDQKVHCYHIKGRKLYTLYMPEQVSCIEMLKLTRARVFKGLLVALANGEIRLYKDKVLLHSLSIGETILGMAFGSYGREEGSLVLNVKSGGIVVKLIDKKANLEGRNEFIGPPPEQEIPLVIPAKSKLYLEQVDREKESARQMYGGFLRDLTSLRLRTAKAYLQLQYQEPTNQSIESQLSMGAYVQGLGPLFTIILEVQNQGRQSSTDIVVSFSYDPKLFQILTPLTYFPCLVPTLKYRQEIAVRSIEGASENIRVFLQNKVSCLPIISAFITIPGCDLV